MQTPHDAQGRARPWPYALAYGHQRALDCDVLVIGGGIAGVWAAIAAARCGARVIILEKAATERSGAGGPGVDHWQLAADNPASAIAPEECTQALIDNQGGYRSGISTYIQCSSAYETLLEMEACGGKVRDIDGAFKGADFRDDASQLLFAYDYVNRTVIRVWGHDFKPLLREQCRQLGVRVFDRVAVTSLLTEGGREGSAVVGATAVHTRSGAFIVVRAKATVLATNRPQRIWTFSSELRGISTFRPPSCAGSGYSFPPYAIGNAINTWYPCSIVDARGKEVPWVDGLGRPITTLAERCRPAEGQKFFMMGGGSSSQPHPGLPQYRGPKPIPDLEARMMAGEFVPPFYADLASMPEAERRVIWAVMVGNEGKTRIPVKQTYEAAGSDPARDLLQSYDFLRGQGMRDPVLPQARTAGEQGICVGLLVDQGQTPLGNTPEEFAASFAATAPRWITLIKASGAQAQ